MPEGAEERTKEPASGPAAVSKVFLSYASQDAAIANALCDALEAAGIPCWIAPRDVRPGDFYADAIVQAITQCPAFVLILSQAAIDSPHVLREVERASSKRRPIITFRIDSAPLPPGLEYFLSASQWLDASGGHPDRQFPKLIDAVRSRCASPRRTESSPSHSSGTPGKQNRKASVIVLTAVIAALLAYFVAEQFWVSRQGASQDRTRMRTTPLPAPISASLPSTFAPPPHSVAVLPFVNMSGDPKQDYLSDGFSEELLNSLARLNNLQVMARTSSFAFKGQSVDISTIAHQLNVGSVLEGSVRRAGNTMRVTAQLINAVTGFQVWSQTYDRQFGDILKIQTEVAAAVAQQLQVRLGGESAKLDVGATNNPEAYDAYLRAVRQLRDGDQSPAETRAVLASTDRVVALDPQYAAIHAFRSYLFMSLSRSEPRLDKRTDLSAQAVASANRAIALAPEFAQAHAALGFARLVGFWDFPGASLEIERALALAPGDSTLNADYGLFAAQLRHFDAAVEATRRAVSLDPQDWLPYRQQALVLYYARRFVDAEVAIKHALLLKPGSHGVNGLQITILIGAGDVEQSLRLCESSTTPLDDDDRHYYLALLYHALGRQAEAQRELEHFKELDGDNWPTAYAQLFAQWGNVPASLQWLAKAEQRHDNDLMFLKADPLLDPLRDKPQFKLIEARLNFPP